MRYPGSKRRLTKVLKELIVPYATTHTTYVEPFLGGANSFAQIAPYFEHSVALEGNHNVFLMWQCVAQGWTPPNDVTEEQYASFKEDQPATALRGFIGSGCSFGGKWFGGYARGGYNADGTPRNHQAESSRAVTRKANAFTNTLFVPGSYENAPITKDCVVYCDPPYANTLQYSGSNAEFDTNQFWQTANHWVDLGAKVFVSEYEAPPDWTQVYSQSLLQSVSKADTRNTVTEKIFTK